MRWDYIIFVIEKANFGSIFYNMVAKLFTYAYAKANINDYFSREFQLKRSIR